VNKYGTKVCPNCEIELIYNEEEGQYECERCEYVEKE